ncbi:uncharacterized protein [Rutidosis leptorrhynchoides]|uniref:uncharacterized protein n=1 Tax=Rutidosis leptorrhynchoides TaxID=125765 RepID=UPI003A9A5C9B
MLQGFEFVFDNRDKWSWSAASDGTYTVKKMSSIIDQQVFACITDSIGTFRNLFLPKKLEIFAWRVIKRRMPVRLELDKRGIDLHSVRCPLCDDDVESIEHCFIFCKFSMEIWERVHNWWGLGAFTNLSLNKILRGNTAASTTCEGKLIWQAIEWVCTYFNWKNRNNKAFHGKSWCSPVALNEIQIKSFEWISVRAKKKKIDWLTWLNNPKVYLSS